MRFLLVIIVITVPVWVLGQDTLYHENFNSNTHTFVLNTTDVNSTVGGFNQWTVNQSFSGGAGSLTCFGLPFSFTVPDTPNQPAGITSSPQSRYAHMVSTDAINSGINCCTFRAADGICVSNESYFMRMNNDINTVGYDSIELSFWWICGGGTDSYGELFYSTDGGNTWTKEQTIQQYNSSTSWTKITVADPQFGQQATLRIGFRFVNNVTLAASDPGFGIDDISFIGHMTTGVEEYSKPEVTIYPNPASDSFFIETDPVWEMTGWNLSSTDGRKVFEGTNDRRVELENIYAGMYILQIRFGDQVVTRKVFVK